MADAVSRRSWQIASAQMALLANVNRDPKRNRAFKPTDFDPYSQPAGPPPKADISILKVFLPGHGS